MNHWNTDHFGFLTVSYKFLTEIATNFIPYIAHWDHSHASLIAYCSCPLQVVFVYFVCFPAWICQAFCIKYLGDKLFHPPKTEARRSKPVCKEESGWRWFIFTQFLSFPKGLGCFLLVFPPFSACFWPVFRGRRRNWGGNVQWWWSGGRGWNLSARSPPFSCTIDSLLPRLKSGWMLLPWTTLCRPVWQCYRATKETFDIRDRDDIVILWWYFW